MWNRSKWLVQLRVPTLRQTEGHCFTAAKSSSLSDRLPVIIQNSKFLKANVTHSNDISMMAFSSNHQQPPASLLAATDVNHKEGVVEGTIRKKLLASLSPVTHLTILNESHRHNVPVNSETHFKVVIVSPVFDTIPTLVGRHRLVNTILADELSSSGPIHALSIVAKTSAQWLQQKQQSNGTLIEPSPPCLGGDRSLPPKRS